MTSSKYSLTALIQVVNTHFLLILGSLVILGVGFFGGSLWTENKLLKAGGLGTSPTAQQAGAQAPAPQPQQPTKGVASVDDDPVLGDKNAPVTIVEFSDYECPFCKRHFSVFEWWT